MNKCKYCNKRIWLTNYWCMKCLEKIVDEIIKENFEKTFIEIIKNRENK